MPNDEKAESDVEPDPKRADSRATGGVPDPDAPDQASTTGSTPDGEYVGRIAGSDVGYAEETGAERRSDDTERDRGLRRLTRPRGGGRRHPR